MDIITLKLQDEIYQLEDLEFSYIFSYLLRFDFKQQTTLLNAGSSSLIGDDLKHFKESLTVALRELLSECYVAPNPKRRQKHPTYYEKFLFDDKRYVVDYTTSTVGRLMFTLRLRLTLINKAIDSGQPLLVTLSSSS